MSDLLTLAAEATRLEAEERAAWDAVNEARSAERLARRHADELSTAALRSQSAAQAARQAHDRAKTEANAAAWIAANPNSVADLRKWATMAALTRAGLASRGSVTPIGRAVLRQLGLTLGQRGGGHG